MNDSAKFWHDMKLCHAVWEHPGDPKAPHVRLRSGRHSNGFIDSLQYLSMPDRLSSAANVMAHKLLEKIGVRPVWVFGSPMAGIPFATTVGIRMHVQRVGFTEKVGDKDQICRFDVVPGATFLDIEEMTTSGGTPQRLIDAVMKKNPGAISSPFIGAFLIRCERKPSALLGKEIIPLVDLPELGVHYHEWDAAECPLCAEGSPAITNAKKVWFDLLQTMADPRHVIPGAEYADGQERRDRARKEVAKDL
jgi:orotate phosphoribosyltransferase